jgi:hypothetical protein
MMLFFERMNGASIDKYQIDSFEVEENGIGFTNNI